MEIEKGDFSRSGDRLSTVGSPPELQTVFVGRQPIFDRELRVYGYELLFRSSETAGAGAINGEIATAQVINNAFQEIGPEQILGPHRAFINCPDTLLRKGHCLVLSKDRVVLEVLESAIIDEGLVKVLQWMRQQGYAIALDDFVYHPRWEPLIPLAEIIKLDVKTLNTIQIRNHYERLRPRGAKLLAEKVETPEEFECYRDMGFDLFQGYFLARPMVVTGKKLPAARLAVLRLLARLNNPAIEFEQLEAELNRDPVLSYKLLRYVNSAFFGLSRRFSSVRQATVYLGLESIRRWVTLISMAGLVDKRHELIRMALARAKMCELLYEKVQLGDKERAFTVGLFSLLDALLGIPIPDVLQQLPLAEDVNVAIRDHSGALGAALHCVIAYEQGNWHEISFRGISSAVIKDAYARAVRWSFKAAPWFVGQEG
ncbi:MAG: HDOD domain-containing protein [Gammaproteobacteria bacterium]|jgi:EAL and modified HD-GYP domain-containing signal transduction protein